jgi:hypothetical protein
VPTYERTQEFIRAFSLLSARDRQRFRKKVAEEFIPDLKSGHGFGAGLRVKGVRGRRAVYEMTWAPDGRATFEYGTSIRQGEPHIIWRQIGSHDIF